MSNIILETKRLQGAITAPADKSISHRTIIIGSISRGKTQVKNLSLCADCRLTLDAFKSMGVPITKSKGLWSIKGRGLQGLQRPAKGKLYLGNSGTSMRLILGVLAGQRFNCELSGDASLSRRPMKRVTEPLSLMGAKITARDGGEFAPLTIRGSQLLPISYALPVASAQVKSAILLAGLYTEGTTAVREPAKSRDHTERMLKRFGAPISVQGLEVSINGRSELETKEKEIEVPGDISSASFFIVGACIAGNSSVTVKSVGLNPTRTAFLDILQQMGASVTMRYQNRLMAAQDYEGEAIGEIAAKSSQLKAIIISPRQVPSLIDELPILMVAATQAEGTTIIQGAAELRVKETDRIKAMVVNMSRMGADIQNVGNDIIIRGPVKLGGSIVQSFADHRTAMSMCIAALVARGRTDIKDTDCIDISFPGFLKELIRLTQ